jgi:cobalt-zinc-cadmium efflux system membrane fusion protein
MNKAFSIILIVAMVLLSISCNTKKINDIDATSNSIVFTREQFDAMKMEISQPQSYVMQEYIRTNGFVKPSSDGVTQISPPVEGQVSEVRFTAGNFVEKGALLFKVGGNRVIELQNNYVKACANFELAQHELERISNLVGEQISPRKELVAAQTSLKMANAEKQSLKALLRAININPDKVENGNISPDYTVIAPISGYLSEMNAVNGQFIGQQEACARIVDTRKLVLILNVFEKDVQQLRPGQEVNFYDPDRKTLIQRAWLRSVGRSIDPETKTIPCIAHIENVEELNLMEGMYAESKVIVSSRETQVLPSEAIITIQNEHFVLVKTGESGNEVHFKKVAIEPGQIQNGFTEIKTPGLNDVLVKGTYYYQTGD